MATSQSARQREQERKIVVKVGGGISYLECALTATLKNKRCVGLCFPRTLQGTKESSRPLGEEFSGMIEPVEQAWYGPVGES
jgi:hypothetical protein